ncbi:MAG: lipopolysaccharide biosynthesis protein [Blastocatellia bacterium]
MMSLAKATAEPKSFAGRTIWMATAKTIALVLALALPLILVRWLNPEQLGLYRQAFQVLTTSLSLLGLQVAASAYYFTPREPERRSQVALNVLVFYLGVGAIVALVFACFPRWVTPIMNGDSLVPIVPLLGVTLLLWLIGLNLESVVIANGDIRWSSVVTVLIQLLKTSLLILAAVIGGGVRAMMFAALIIGVVHCAVCVVYLRRKFGNFWRGFDWRLFKAQLASALPFGVGGIAYIIQFDLHNYYITSHFSPAEFAVYSIGCFQLPILQVLIDAIETILLPEIARLEKDGEHRRIFRVWINSMRMLAFVFFPVCAMLFVLRREFILTLFTATYAAATSIFAINLFNILLYILLVGTVLRAFPQLKYFRIKFCLLLLPITWVALYIGISVGGMVGVIAAVALTRLFDAGVTLTVVGRRLGLGWRDLREFAPMGRLALTSLIAATVTIATKLALSHLSAQLILLIGAMVFGLSYLIAVFTLGAITSEEKARLRALWLKFYQFGVVRVGLASASEAQ